ncbi:MAG: hypothetical protein ABIH52_00705 [Candidatus Aenigmatarchaeota archaeon]|nr:hypothetical protein [Nanoarchaeota archaeon]
MISFLTFLSLSGRSSDRPSSGSILRGYEVAPDEFQKKVNHNSGKSHKEKQMFKMFAMVAVIVIMSSSVSVGQVMDSAQLIAAKEIRDSLNVLIDSATILTLNNLAEDCVCEVDSSFKNRFVKQVDKFEENKLAAYYMEDPLSASLFHKLNGPPKYDNMKGSLKRIRSASRRCERLLDDCFRLYYSVEEWLRYNTPREPTAIDSLIMELEERDI